MDYYGSNDWRNYLAHHGILGQKWGIRRFQPYGSGGYNRKDGEAGKNIGEARKQQKKLYKYMKSSTRYLYETSQQAEDVWNEAYDSRKRYIEAAKPIRDFNDISDKKKLEYMDKAAIYEWKRQGYDKGKSALDPNDYEEQKELWRMEFREDNHDYDMFAAYCRDKGINSEKVMQRVEKAYLDYSKARDKAIENSLGEFGDKPIKRYRKPGDKLVKTGKITANQRALDGFYFLDSAYYDLNNAVRIQRPKEDWSYWPKLKWD